MRQFFSIIISFLIAFPSFAGTSLGMTGVQLKMLHHGQTLPENLIKHIDFLKDNKEIDSQQFEADFSKKGQITLKHNGQSALIQLVTASTFEVNGTLIEINTDDNTLVLIKKIEQALQKKKSFSASLFNFLFVNEAEAVLPPLFLFGAAVVFVFGPLVSYADECKKVGMDKINFKDKSQINKCESLRQKTASEAVQKNGGYYTTSCACLHGWSNGTTDKILSPHQRRQCKDKRFISQKSYRKSCFNFTSVQKTTPKARPATM